MSELPPNIDAILASIRSRMADDGTVPAPPVAQAQPAPAPPAPALPAIDPGATLLAGGDMTLDGLMRALLEPMLQNWLDANLPEIVEKIAQAEIRRLTGRG
jgi:Protein of unknown function (DUF2497)